MNEIKFTITEGGKKTVKTAWLASDWAEMPKDGVLAAMPFVMMNDRSPEAVTSLLHTCCNGTGKYLLDLDAEVVAGLFPCVEWMFEKRIDSPVLDYFSHNGLEYLLPDAKLANVTCGEWLFADDYYTKFLKNKDVTDLNRLISTLARQRDKDQDAGAKRDDFRVELHSRKQIELWTNDLVDLDDKVKLFVLAFFSGCKEWVYETYTGYIFEEEEALEEGQLPEVKTPTMMQKMGWYGLYQKAAETAVFGDLENILKRVKFKDFCVYLMAKKAEFDERERGRFAQKPNAD
jgi:hypothetical protein